MTDSIPGTLRPYEPSKYGYYKKAQLDNFYVSCVYSPL